MLLGLNDDACKMPGAVCYYWSWVETSRESTHSPLPSDEQNGTLKIIDRKKHIFKLAQGEYIAPEKIENVYLRSEAVAQVFVHGESLQVGAVWAVSSDVQAWCVPGCPRAVGAVGSFRCAWIGVRAWHAGMLFAAWHFLSRKVFSL